MNHRFYSYRMKQQGRSWSSEGMEHMVWVLTARKNKTLTQALLYHANGKSYKKMDRAEMNHRFYSYRMKQQGRSWSSEGMEHMVWVLTARKNKTLTQALLYHANGKSYKKMDRAMHKAVVQAERRMRNLGQDAWKGV